jgi:hypothetical protein
MSDSDDREERAQANRRADNLLTLAVWVALVAVGVAYVAVKLV